MKSCTLIFTIMMILTSCMIKESPSTEDVHNDKNNQGSQESLTYNTMVDTTEAAYCLPYTPQGQVVYDSEWTGEYPAIELYDKEYKTATFGMGCFWGPAAEYATIEGVLRTRVGYTGGSLTTPTYESLGNHSEVFEVDYDPDIVSYEDLIHYYFQNFDTRTRPFSLRVNSIIYYRNDSEKMTAQSIKEGYESDYGAGLYAKIDKLDVFYLAEDRHQLSYLKSEISLYNEIRMIYPTSDKQLLSILASKLNGYIAGYGSKENLNQILDQSGLSEPSINRINDIVAVRYKDNKDD